MDILVGFTGTLRLGTVYIDNPGQPDDMTPATAPIAAANLWLGKETGAYVQKSASQGGGNGDPNAATVDGGIASGQYNCTVNQYNTDTPGKFVVVPLQAGIVQRRYEFNVVTPEYWAMKYGAGTMAANVVEVGGDASAANNLRDRNNGTGGVETLTQWVVDATGQAAPGILVTGAVNQAAARYVASGTGSAVEKVAASTGVAELIDGGVGTHRVSRNGPAVSNDASLVTASSVAAVQMIAPDNNGWGEQVTSGGSSGGKNINVGGVARHYTSQTGEARVEEAISASVDAVILSPGSGGAAVDCDPNSNGIGIVNSKIEDAVFTRPYEGTRTLEKHLRLGASLGWGKTTGTESNTPTFRDDGDTKNRIQTTYNQVTGNRDAVTVLDDT